MLGCGEPKCIGVLMLMVSGLQLFSSISALWFREPNLIYRRWRTDQFPIHTEAFFEQMMTNCINHQIIFTRTEDNLKNIIKDKMKLRTNITSPQISDICHQRWVIIRENKELTHLSTSIPFWNFLTILKFGVHHESWKSPDLSSEKISISLGGQLNWSESCCFARCQIVQVGCMLDSKWP